MRILAATITCALLSCAISPAALAEDATSSVESRVASGRFTVVVSGDGPDVVLIPGLASSASVWAETVRGLAAKHRVHLVQVAGFAGSPTGSNAQGPVFQPLVEALADYIRRAGLRAPAIIGHSMGGEAALLLAARHPEAVGRVLVVDALPFFPLLLNPSATADAMRPQAATMRAALETASPAQFSAMQSAAATRLVKTDAARGDVAAAAATSDKRVVARATEELLTTDLRAELPRIKAPLGVLYAHDPRFGVTEAAVDALYKSAYAEAPAARLERIDDSFHFIMLDQPVAFAETVARFLVP